MVEVHAVAALLTPEMKERVRAAAFRLNGSGISERDEDSDHGYRRCPLAVAAGIDVSARHSVYRALGVIQPNAAVESFMLWADSIYSDPADVKAMLGCEP